MFRTLFEIPIPFIGKTIPIHSYGFMMAAGFFVGIIFARWRAKKEGIDPDLVSDIGIYVLCSGIVGARLFFVVQNFAEYRGNLVSIFKVYEGGLVFYGGLIASLGTLLLYVKIKKLPFLKVMDVISPSLALGIAFGRIGCFLNGCCYGDVAGSGVFCAVKFPKTIDMNGMVNGSPVFLHHFEHGLVDLSQNYSLPVHPSQLYSSIACIIIFFILNAFWKYRGKDGNVLLMFGIVYSVYRFCIEFVRDDNIPLFDSLTISQNISIMVFLCSVILFIKRLKVLKNCT